MRPKHGQCFETHSTPVSAIREVIWYISTVDEINPTCCWGTESTRICIKMAYPRGIEPLTFWSVARRSIQLSYGYAGALLKKV